ncbi:hypothetical protein BMS3Bbin01_00017 [bacterium BMS3Bbin01]|nr:hypothetical protein BMS3Bbin01_00017 [bacterium BMS3Bbin01]
MRGTVFSRPLVLLGLVLVMGACSPEPADQEIAGETTAGLDSTTDASEYDALRAAARGADVETAGKVMAAVLADLRNLGQAGDGEQPGPQDIVDALSRIDWAEAIGGDDARSIAANFERATVFGGVAALLGASPTTNSGSAALMVAGDTRSVPAAFAFDAASTDRQGTIAHEEGTISQGTKSGTTSMDATRTMDPDSGRETTVWTTRVDVTDSATGKRTIAETKVEISHDVCWGEDGARQAEITTTTNVTVVTAEGTKTSTTSRTTTTKRRPDGSISTSVSVTVDGVTVAHTLEDSDLSGPPTEEVSDDGETATFTIREGRSTTTVSASKEAMSVKPEVWDEKLGEAADAMGDAERLQQDLDVLVQALQPPLTSGAPGGNQYCLKFSVDPSAASLEPDGETVAIDATVLDWQDRPVVGAIVTVSGARLGSVDPQIGPASTDGTWTTTYTSGKQGTETLTFEAARYGYKVKRTAKIKIGTSTWAFAMTLNIEDVTFLWDGVFSVDGGEIDGGGIGTIIGSGQCVWESSDGDYVGPVAQVTGSFTFDTFGTGTLEEDSGTMSLRVESSEAEAEISYEDPNCGALVDLLKDFLRTTPTITNAFPREFQIEIVDGQGTLTIPQDPYALEIEVSRIGD